MASEYVDEGFEGLDVNLADVNLGDVARASGADGDALEAMVMDAVKRKTAGASNASDGSNPRPIEPNEEAFRASVAFEDSDANANANDDSGVYEVDPTRWSERVDAARVAAAAAAETRRDGGARSAPPPIEEPESAQANPASSRANVRDAAIAGPPPERARETVEARVMTKRMLRELAMRRGVSYTELLAQAEASGVELPEE